MIETEKQYHTTRRQLDHFRSALYAFDHELIPTPENELLKQAEREGLLAVIQDLEEELAAWEER